MKINIGKYKNNRKVDIHIDGYDLWNMDHTLALIIHPMLVMLKEGKQGSPDVDNEDVPEHLQSPEHNIMDPVTTVWGTDDVYHERWQYVLDEMIWAFGQIIDKEVADSQFFNNGFDKDGYIEWSNRINNGTKLFGKYYQGLWT